VPLGNRDASRVGPIRGNVHGKPGLPSSGRLGRELSIFYAHGIFDEERAEHMILFEVIGGGDLGFRVQVPSKMQVSEICDMKIRSVTPL
jgi:hypothetical protein